VIPLSCRLALADLRHARISTMCQIVGFASLLVPLLILFGIKNGVIADRTEALLKNPEDLRITISGQALFSPEFVANLAANPDVRFAGPHPINLAVLAGMALPVNGGAFVDRVTLLATGAGDPYLPNTIPPPAPGEVILSASLAGALGQASSAVLSDGSGENENSGKNLDHGLRLGDPVELLLPPRKGHDDGGFLTLTVIGTLPAGTWGRNGALMHKDDLFLVQDWGNGALTDPNLDKQRGKRATPDQYPLLRLYARDVDSAFRLVETLATQGFSTGASLGKAQTLLSLRTALETGFLTVAIVGFFGVTVTFSASLWSAINRNRRAISLLRLGGLGRGAAILLPVTQALVIGISGWLVSLGLYVSLSGALDFALGDIFGVSGSLAQITLTEVLASGVATFVVSALAAATAAIAVTRITPEEGFLDAA
jgi:putative ABC transport system permease protein